MFEQLTPLEDHDWDLEDALSGSIPTSEVLADCLAGGTGAGRVQLLAQIEPAELAAAERIDLLVALERQKAWLDSLQQATLAVIDQADTTTMSLSQEAVMCALRLSGRGAQSRLKVARTLTESLPATFALLRRGVLSTRQAELIAQASWSVLPDVLARFEGLVLSRVGEQTDAELRKTIQRSAIQVDPATAEARHLRAKRDRGVRIRPAWDGMSELCALLPATDAEAILARLDGAPRGCCRPRMSGPGTSAARTCSSTACCRASRTTRCPSGRVTARRCRWWCRPQRCWASTTNRLTCPATAPSPPRPRGNSPPIRPGPGNDCSPTPIPAPCSIAAPRTTGHPRT
jgi:hypothetical protein